MCNIRQSLATRSLKQHVCICLCVCMLLAATAASEKNHVTPTSLIRQIEQHTANKQRVLTLLSVTPRLQITKRFGGDFKDTWRRILIDGHYGDIEKTQFLETTLRGFTDSQQELPRALQSLLKSHRLLFSSGQNHELMIRHAEDPAFKPFGVHMSLAQAIAAISAANDEQVQAFKTIFETGQNTRGYIHKLECHAEAVEFIYAVTDIVYGVMLPTELQFGPKRVVAQPTKVRLFYVRAGNVIALHPYVLHSGSLSVEPDRSFSIIIYKKPARPSMPERRGTRDVHHPSAIGNLACGFQYGHKRSSKPRHNILSRK